ncbi:MAG: efflux transporter outer membrane subunit [Desulfuromonadales bacterium]|nr:efflux transporter outer membrane subunit [Desulfuromonadales bacterium]NIR33328.1 efflux transporter outer membrane subunit [Desulfuromonadales bacterium]NIS42114.1 efflux transporter outer membrane subunit [Desulfuromonadales bacterium]
MDFERIIGRTLLCALVCLLMTACTPHTKEAALPLDVPEAFSANGSSETSAAWWRAFRDPALNDLLEQAIRSNFTLEAAWYRLREAEAVVDREASQLRPVLDAEAVGEGRWTESAAEERLRLGLAAQYEIDLWGRIRGSIEAEKHRLAASREDYRTAALSLAAEVVRTWFSLAEARQQREVLEEQIEANRKVLRLIRARFGNGAGRRVDILRQEQLLESTREQKIAEEARIEVLEHLLAVLAGRSPREGVARFETGPLPELPPLPETGLPLDLIRRRPDVRRAYHLLQAADRDLAAAISNRYPRLTLTASLSTTEDDTRNLFDDWVAALAANMLAPIIDGGQRRAEVRRNEALRNRRLSSWAQASLTAFQEVEDALTREKKQVERIASLRQQIRLARQSLEQLRNEYYNGVSNYIEVLTALTGEQRLRRDLLAARRQLLEFRVGLYRALSGGFETSRETADGNSG